MEHSRNSAIKLENTRALYTKEKKPALYIVFMGLEAKEERNEGIVDRPLDPRLMRIPLQRISLL